MTTRLSAQQYQDLVRADSDLLAAAAAKGLDADVPPCPGWTVRDVVTHTAEVYEHKLRCIADGASPDPWPPQWPDREPVEWFLDARDRLLVALDQSAETSAYSWWPPEQTVGFWQRRMAQETAMHRVDAQSASDSVTPVDQALAADGIDEVLMIMPAGDWSDEPVTGANGRVDITAGGHRWTVSMTDAWLTTLADPGTSDERTSDGPQHEGTPDTDPHADPDATVSGDAGAVLLWLWGRAGDDAVELSGRSAAAAALRTRLAHTTQ